ncbi:MAG: hypothetical protein ACPL2F_03650 [Dissulfurimicrobium hydrothermale]|uniref:hypothetical protein n=2 Tax=Dissulfurimicrobium hydrothermale TaxID=1750598 RepID=UPI003C793308
MKRIVVVLAMLLLVAVNAQAVDWSVVKSGAYGQLSSSTWLATYYYAMAGEKLIIWSDKTGLWCEVMGATYRQALYGLKENSVYTTLYDDLYILVCIAPYYNQGYGGIAVIALP